MNKISKFHYITVDNEKISHEEQIERACDGGAKWIQLRIKNKDIEDIKSIAFRVKAICKIYGATFIINDYVELAKELQADGVHLGKSDMSVTKARKILGDEYIIGGTANTIGDIKQLQQEMVNYIGLGPYRFTETKKNLSPLLGIEGYKNIIGLCKSDNIKIPIIAIGGIKYEDISLILQTGIYGIAISSAITFAENPTQEIEKYLKTKFDHKINS